MDFRDNANSKLQILVFGLEQVGKTTIIQQLRDISAHILEWEEHDRTGEGMESERLVFQEVTGFQFPSFRKLAVTRSDAFILTYAIGDETSFDYATRFIAEIRYFRGDDVPIFVVGNKACVDGHQVDAEITDNEVIMNSRCTHLEVCALDGYGMKDLFSCMLGHLGHYFVKPGKDVNILEKRQSFCKRLSDYLRKKLSVMKTP